MTDFASHVVETTAPETLRWAFRQVRVSKVNPDSVAMALKPAASQAELRAVAQGLRDLAKMPADKLPEALR